MKNMIEYCAGGHNNIYNAVISYEPVLNLYTRHCYHWTTFFIIIIVLDCLNI
ncbi:hypothetical protein CLU79DRAFT_769507 [Phycomyces nitens]|nr:hypothetical protein CLU79DRAFT_769507 [Phycomyces nitens]